MIPILGLLLPSGRQYEKILHQRVDRLINILIIEDHEIVIWALERMLTKAIDGVVVKSTPIFEEGVQMLTQQPADLIILDIGVPGGNSIEAIQHLRTAQPDAKILIHTGLPEAEYATAYLIAGADGFVSKHASFEDVLEACQTILDNKRYISALARQTIENDSPLK